MISINGWNYQLFSPKNPESPSGGSPDNCRQNNIAGSHGTFRLTFDIEPFQLVFDTFQKILFLSWETLTGERFLIVLMCFLNLTDWPVIS